MEKRLLKLWLFVILLLLAGCGSGTGSAETAGTEITIIYERQGGLTGLSQEWVIHLDGRIDAPGDLEMQVPAEEVQAVLEHSSEMAEAPTTPEPAPCCDRYTYTLTIIIGDQETTYTIYDGAPTGPQEMQMFAAVENLINTAEPLP